MTRIVRRDEPTGTVVALVEPDGQRSMLTDRGANLLLRAEDVDRALGDLGAGDHVHVSGYSLLDEASRGAGRRALERAVACRASRSADASSVGPLRALGPERFLEWVAQVDYLFCNLDEAALLSGRREARDAASALADWAGEVVVTDGARGAQIATGRGVLAVPADERLLALDTTGAGDAFAGTYLAQRLAGAEVLVAARSAASAAATAVASPGARPWARYSRK